MSILWREAQRDGEPASHRCAKGQLPHWRLARRSRWLMACLRETGAASSACACLHFSRGRIVRATKDNQSQTGSGLPFGSGMEETCHYLKVKLRKLKHHNGRNGTNQTWGPAILVLSCNSTAGTALVQLSGRKTQGQQSKVWLRESEETPWLGKPPPLHVDAASLGATCKLNV